MYVVYLVHQAKTMKEYENEGHHHQTKEGKNKVLHDT